MDSHIRRAFIRYAVILIVILTEVLLTPLVVKAAFEPLDIPLPEELQKHLYQSCEDYNVPYAIMLAIIEHESRYIWQPARLDVNGLYSVGFCQINQPNWAWLSEMGLDVHDERDNLTAGVVIMSKPLENHSAEKSLVIYQCGEYGAINIESTEFSRWILERSVELRDEIALHGGNR